MNNCKTKNLKGNGIDRLSVIRKTVDHVNTFCYVRKQEDIEEKNKSGAVHEQQEEE